jgi:hypothetical protein
MNIKIGEIFRRSWGYDQTNVDYFQVVELKAKTVVVRGINYAQVKGSEGSMSCLVVPVKDSFIESSAPLRVRVSEDSRFITVGPKKLAHLVLVKADGSYPGAYCSWYA